MTGWRRSALSAPWPPAAGAARRALTPRVWTSAAAVAQRPVTFFRYGQGRRPIGALASKTRVVYLLLQDDPGTRLLFGRRHSYQISPGDTVELEGADRRAAMGVGSGEIGPEATRKHTARTRPRRLTADPRSFHRPAQTNRHLDAPRPPHL